jgi:uncharacterized protein (DUF433 family)
MVITRTTRMGRIRITGNRKVVWAIMAGVESGIRVALEVAF